MHSKTFFPLVALGLVGSLQAAAQTGASVCASILMSDDKVKCLQTIAGHTVEPGAAAVCNQVLMGDDKIACLRGTLDKRYQPDELAACRSVLMGGDKANCMAAAGAIPQPVVQQRPAVGDDDDRPARRSRRSRDDDDEDRPRRSRRDDRDDRDERMRTLRLTNFHAGVVSRFYWRRPDERKFHEISLPARIKTNTYQDLLVADETIEACVETPDGYRLDWSRVRRSEALIIGADEQNWGTGACRDLR